MSETCAANTLLSIPLGGAIQNTPSLRKIEKQKLASLCSCNFDWLVR
jgi:hypothetical protein